MGGSREINITIGVTAVLLFTAVWSEGLPHLQIRVTNRIPMCWCQEASLREVARPSRAFLSGICMLTHRVLESCLLPSEGHTVKIAMVPSQPGNRPCRRGVSQHLSWDVGKRFPVSKHQSTRLAPAAQTQNEREPHLAVDALASDGWEGHPA